MSSSIMQTRPTYGVRGKKNSVFGKATREETRRKVLSAGSRPRTLAVRAYRVDGEMEGTRKGWKCAQLGPESAIRSVGIATRCRP